MNKYQELKSKIIAHLESEKARRDKLENAVSLFCSNFAIKFNEYLGEKDEFRFRGFNIEYDNTFYDMKFENNFLHTNFNIIIDLHNDNRNLIDVKLPITFYFFKNHIIKDEKYLSINIEKSKDEFTFFDCVDPNLTEDNLNVISPNNLMERWYNAIYYHVISNEKFVNEYKGF